MQNEGKKKTVKLGIGVGRVPLLIRVGHSCTCTGAVKLSSFVLLQYSMI